LNFREGKINEINYQKFLQKEREAQEKIEKKNYLMGKFNPSTREDFVLIPTEYTTDKSTMYLRKETLDAFLKMHDAAAKDKIDLKIASATRNFNYQKDFWNKIWTGASLLNKENLAKSILDNQKRFKKILEYVAVPGTSRHHFGTDIDLNGGNASYFNSEVGKKEYAWLVKNAFLFGFCQPYNLKGEDRTTGYNEEKWHWSYFPLAKNFTQEYKNLVKDEDIKGFLGDENVAGKDLINNYVLDINPDCF
jgi:LAS superfamily LD-carboxypeptidase LdcB